MTDTRKVLVARREKYHEQLITRFDSDVPLEVRQFWFISSMLDPRYKKLVFKNDNMLTQGMRRDAVKWLTEAYNKNFKGKVAKAATTTATTTSAPETFLKRRKVSAAGFFGEESSDDEAPDGDAAILEELEEYLALPQIKMKTDFGV